MPDHKIHAVADYMLLGRTFPEVHRYMDMYQPLLQSKHRNFHHDEQTITHILQITGNLMAAWSAYYHILLDNESDKVGQELALPALLQKVWSGKIPNPFLTTVVK
jgi:hypothetical protein